jgi:hypothetical protein
LLSDELRQGGNHPTYRYDFYGFNEEFLAADNEFANFHPPTTRSSASRWSNQSAPVKTSMWLSGK